MIVDLRIYTAHPGQVQPALAFYEAEAWPLQRRHLGTNLGFFVTECGPLNRIVHLWRYDGMADREVRRAALEADPRWQSLKAKTAERGYMQAQENWILRPTGFSPIT